MRVFCISILLSALCCPSQSFVFSGNEILRFMFRGMTKDSGWPAISKNHLQIEECAHFNKSVQFPKYYLADFHAYDGGNLNPVAAKDAHSATFAAMKHHYENLTGRESSHFIRSGFSVTARSKNIHASRDKGVQRVVDFGCGVGVSTWYLRHHFQNAEVSGIDLSPFYLQETRGVDARFVHGNIESTGIPSGTVDVVCLSYVLHELPCEVSFQVLREAARILKKGTGVIAILDMYKPRPSSPLMKYIFKRTEPYLDEYGEFLDAVGGFMQGIGFEDVDICLQIPKTIVLFAKTK